MIENTTSADAREPNDEHDMRSAAPRPDTNDTRKPTPKRLSGLANNQAHALAAWLAPTRPTLLATSLLVLTPLSIAKGSPATIVDLGALPGSLKSDAAAISAKGVVVGNVLPGSIVLGEPSASPIHTQAVSYAGGVVTALGLPSGVPSAQVIGTRALGINSSGLIVGYANVDQASPGSYYHFIAVVFSGGTATPLGALPGDEASLAFAVDSSGQAVGFSEPASGHDTHPTGSRAVLFVGGAVLPLGTLPGDSESVAYSLNDAGVAVGWSMPLGGGTMAVQFSNGKVTPLRRLSGDTDSAAFAINASEEAVGYSAGPSGFHAAAFRAGKIIQLLPLQGDVNAQALALDAFGVAVGTSDANGYTTHAVIFPGQHAVSLDSLLPPGSGWTLQTATAINDTGQIIGQGTHNGQTHAYLLNIGPAGAAGNITELSPNPPPAPPGAPVTNGLRTVALHYDYMVLAGPNGHSEAPNPATLQVVVAAFARQGITLSIDSQPHAIPERRALSSHFSTAPGCTGPDSADFFALKAHYFKPSVPIERYTIFADNLFSDTFTHFANCHSIGYPIPTINTIGGPETFGGSGYAELPGSDFVVALGTLTQEKGFYPTTNLVGAPFMHELGHTLVLLHGGNEDSNYKPNYLSVMNYLYALGIPSADAVGSPTLTHFRLDYSGQVLPVGGNTPGILDESNFNEQAGLGSGTADLMELFCTGGAPSPHRFVPTTGPIDYDGDDDATNLHASNISRFDGGGGCAQYPAQLHGFNDWATISANLAAWANIPASITSITQAGGSVTLRGVNLSTTFSPAQGGTFMPGAVMFTGSFCSDATPNPDGSVSAYIPQGAQSEPVTLITPVGDATSSQSITILTPTITLISPSPVAIGATFTITRTGFTTVKTVRFTGVNGGTVSAQTTVKSDMTITAAVPAGAITGPISVDNAYGAYTSIQTLLIPVPIVTGLTTISGPPGTAITVIGQHFTGATRVSVQQGNTSVSCPFSVVDDSHLTMTFCALSGGTWDVVVVNSYGASPLVLTDQFTVAFGAPTITGFTPTAGPVGTIVTISGANLMAPGTLVYFSGCNAATGCYMTPTINADWIISVTVPTAAVSGPIMISNQYGSATSTQSFTVT